MASKHILIVNLHAMSNRGDAAINITTLNIFHQLYPTAEITLAANIPREFEHLGVAVVPSFKTWLWSKSADNRAVWHLGRFPMLIAALVSLLIWRFTKRLVWVNRSRTYELLAAYVQADVVVNCGGNTMYARHPRAFAYWLIWFAQFCAIVCRKPLVCLPQTVGPFYWTIHAQAAGWLYRRARLVMVRDLPSYQLLVNQLGVPPKLCIHAPDLVVYHIAKHDRDYAIDSPLIGVSVIDWATQFHHFTAQIQYEDSIKETLEQLIADGYHVVFFAQSDTKVQGENDRIPAERIIANIDVNLRHAVRGIWHIPTHPQELFSFYAQFHMVIATRMHAALLSLIAGTPVVPIAYTLKSWGFARDWGLEDLLLDINQIEGEQLLTSVRQVLRDMDHWHTHIQHKAQDLRSMCDIYTVLQQAIA